MLFTIRVDDNDMDNRVAQGVREFLLQMSPEMRTAFLDELGLCLHCGDDLVERGKRRECYCKDRQS